MSDLHASVETAISAAHGLDPPAIGLLACSGQGPRQLATAPAGSLWGIRLSAHFGVCGNNGPGRSSRFPNNNLQSATLVTKQPRHHRKPPAQWPLHARGCSHCADSAASSRMPTRQPRPLQQQPAYASSRPMRPPAPPLPPHHQTTNNNQPNPKRRNPSPRPSNPSSPPPCASTKPAS
jgi:hypothetical protein